jgi:hypothetical protein
MIRNTTLALAALLVAGSTLTANAESMTNDANTGLFAGYHYGTLADLEAQGLPISASAKKYLKEHGGARTAAGKRGNVYLLEDRPVYGAANGSYATRSYTGYTGHYGSSDDKQRPW